MIDPTYPLFPIFAFLVAFQAWCILTNKAKNAAAAFGVGLISSWGLLWVAAIMVFNDCQTDFARIECVGASMENGHAVNGSVNGSVSSPTKRSKSTETARPDAIAKGSYDAKQKTTAGAAPIAIQCGFVTTVSGDGKTARLTEE